MKKFFLILALLVPGLVQAQNYSIDWFSIDGGGGTSSGGNYTLTGTIGQPDAGKLTGGNYTLEGGFLSGITLVQTLGAPTLSIQFSGANATVSWPVTNSVGFVLQEALNLNSPASWGNSGATITTNSTTKTATIPALGIKFYRLFKP
jgi:hypothetical protein